MKAPKLCASFGLTDVGRKREHNEDCFIVVDGLDLFVVADGMGGHAAGEVASAKAVEVMHDFVARCQVDDEFTWPYGMDVNHSDLENTIATAVKLANREVWRIAQEKQDHHGMGTTVAGALVRGNEVSIAHVGDSRVYQLVWRTGELVQRTEDHSWVNEQLRRGIISPEEAKGHRWKNVITRALGNKEQIEVDVTTVQAEPGDMFLLCSDGLGAGEDVNEMAILQAMLHQHDRLPECARVLISMANEAGGSDNITVIILRFYGTPEEAAQANRDISEDDTNPVMSAQIPGVSGAIKNSADSSPPKNVQVTAEMNAQGDPFANGGKDIFEDDEETQ